MHSFHFHLMVKFLFFMATLTSDKDQTRHRFTLSYRHTGKMIGRIAAPSGVIWRVWIFRIGLWVKYVPWSIKAPAVRTTFNPSRSWW